MNSQDLVQTNPIKTIYVFEPADSSPINVPEEVINERKTKALHDDDRENEAHHGISRLIRLSLTLRQMVRISLKRGLMEDIIGVSQLVIQIAY
ncbi:UNVERIFIED_CONTAM: hypothetical protein Slati_2481700 [Sesamum latifolium]|uniref:Uncharacterized protein n=1 Tax=Sesamum latifolium TaxID=2727402 RepID=A0AAW2WE90_9LAMI